MKKLLLLVTLSWFVVGCSSTPQQKTSSTPPSVVEHWLAPLTSEIQEAMPRENREKCMLRHLKLRAEQYKTDPRFEGASEKEIASYLAMAKVIMSHMSPELRSYERNYVDEVISEVDGVDFQWGGSPYVDELINNWGFSSSEASEEGYGANLKTIYSKAKMIIAEGEDPIGLYRIVLSDAAKLSNKAKVNVSKFKCVESNDNREVWDAVYYVENYKYVKCRIIDIDPTNPNKSSSVKFDILTSQEPITLK